MGGEGLKEKEGREIKTIEREQQRIRRGTERGRLNELGSTVLDDVPAYALHCPLFMRVLLTFTKLLHYI